MHDFLANLSRNYIGHLLLSLIIAVLSVTTVLLFTTKDSKIREWLLAKSGRMQYVGVAVLVLAWLGFFIYNRVTGS